MKGVPFPQEIKDLIINRVRQGESVTVLATEFKVYPNTIRKWLAQAGGVSGVSASGRNLRSNDLLLAKLQREKQELIAIIGELTVINRELSKQFKKK